MRLLSLVPLAVAGATTPPPMSNHVTIVNPWFRALPAKLPAGGYFELRNTGRWPVKLAGASSPACGMLMLHKSERKGGVDTMSDVSSVDVPAGGTLKFAPGGYHLMCMNPDSSLKPGTSVSVMVKFSDGSVTSAKFPVRTATGN